MARIIDSIQCKQQQQKLRRRENKKKKRIYLPYTIIMCTHAMFIAHTQHYVPCAGWKFFLFFFFFHWYFNSQRIQRPKQNKRKIKLKERPYKCMESILYR